MPPIGIRDLTMPMAAFGMVFVLGSYVYNSIGAARRNAEIGRDKMLGEILESRKKLGMDQDPVAFRRRRKEEAAGAAAAAADAADAEAGTGSR